MDMEMNVTDTLIQYVVWRANFLLTGHKTIALQTTTFVGGSAILTSSLNLLTNHLARISDEPSCVKFPWMSDLLFDQ